MQQLPLILWKFLTVAVEGRFGVICLVFTPDISTAFEHHLCHFESWPLTATAIFDYLPIFTIRFIAPFSIPGLLPW
jgi:hypothetical protein